MTNITATLTERSQESGIPFSLLKTVYLREVKNSKNGGPSLIERAFRRVDGFIVYALVRDTSYPQDRDLVTYLP